MKQVAPLKAENHLHPTEARWFAIYTRYKREKTVAKALQQKGIHCYLPIQKLTRYYVRKVKHVDLPLINCYLFVKITKEDYIPVLETQDVVRFVNFSRNLVAIPEEEISILQRVVGELKGVSAEPSRFYPGAEVEIIGGQLTGLKGILLEQQNEKNFVVELNSLGYALLMHIDPGLLELVRGRLEV
ncbi:MAG: UpxY family transcription antiterminator [Chitinophagales bacterium]|nr:UpxY family transcription antiterminator [Chitinophagales bacterium]